MSEVRWWVAQIHTGDAKRTVDRLTAQGFEPESVPGFGYVLLRGEKPEINSDNNPGVIRLLPNSAAPVALPEDVAEAFLATVRAYRHEAERKAEIERNEGSIAGMARSMLANLLRKVGYSVTNRRDRVERHGPPRSGRNHIGPALRKAAKAGAVRKLSHAAVSPAQELCT